ncbi:unnamed protein product [Effrenium voratum]|uniref:Uncharacterized protein n=1 Tax=Effrenium voratum TaxID=2562239 RepID=A0AA36I3G6_9DINO|nr:unnamed protein product [Effrenium voratum]CAJ1379405.1 unnamed protein product [Effrenium voratum]CAJ1414527.1 unnamed protein product [Effrenium voratum]
MGAVGCRRCEDEVCTGFTSQDMVIQRSQTLMDQLQGTWVRSDGVEMGFLSDQEMQWSAAFKKMESTMEEAGPWRVRLKFRATGEVHEGKVFTEMPPTKIEWSDGEIWLLAA